MVFAETLVMRLLTYRIIQLFSLVVLLLAEVLLSFILTWLIKGHGVIACGRGIFDSSTWLLDVIVFIGVPTLFIVGAGSLFLWCSKQCAASLREH